MTRSINRPGRWISRFKSVLAPAPMFHKDTRPDVSPELASLSMQTEESKHVLLLTPTIPAIKPCDL